MSYFFRGSEDGYTFQIFSILHLMLIAVLLAGAYILFAHREEIRQKAKWRRVIRFGFVTLIVIDQLTYVGFCFLERSDGWVQALPLYTCRAALYTGLLAFLTDKKIFKGLTIYWGLFGGILPLVYPDVMAYSWPHFTTVHYFLLHYLVFWMANYFLFVDEYDCSESNPRRLYGLVNALLLAALVVSLGIKGNYAYLLESPILPSFFSRWPRPIYVLFTFAIYNSLVWLVQQMCVKVLIPQLLPEESLPDYHWNKFVK